MGGWVNELKNGFIDLRVEVNVRVDMVGGSGIMGVAAVSRGR